MEESGQSSTITNMALKLSQAVGEAFSCHACCKLEMNVLLHLRMKKRLNSGLMSIESEMNSFLKLRFHTQHSCNECNPGIVVTSLGYIVILLPCVLSEKISIHLKIFYRLNNDLRVMNNSCRWY